MKTEDFTALLDSYGNHFSLAELEIQSPGSIKRMDIGFLHSFLAWRSWHGLPTLISSAWRKEITGLTDTGLPLTYCFLTDG